MAHSMEPYVIYVKAKRELAGDWESFLTLSQ
jgi:hypothetical protein